MDLYITLRNPVLNVNPKSTHECEAREMMIYAHVSRKNQTPGRTASHRQFRYRRHYASGQAQETQNTELVLILDVGVGEHHRRSLVRERHSSNSVRKDRDCQQKGVIPQDDVLWEQVRVHGCTVEVRSARVVRAGVDL